MKNVLVGKALASVLVATLTFAGIAGGVSPVESILPVLSQGSIAAAKAQAEAQAPDDRMSAEEDDWAEAVSVEHTDTLAYREEEKKALLNGEARAVQIARTIQIAQAAKALENTQKTHEVQTAQPGQTQSAPANRGQAAVEAQARADEIPAVQNAQTKQDAAEKAAKEAAEKKAAEEKAAAEKAAAEKAEKERLAAEQAEKERLAAEQAEAERLQAEKEALEASEIISSVVIIEDPKPVIKKITHWACCCGADFTDKDSYKQHALEGMRKGENHGSWHNWTEEVEVWE